MHNEDVVHGDLKGVRFQLHSCLAHNLLCPQANILIKPDGHACLADFSLLTMAPDKSTFISSYVQGGTIQWMSPELIAPENFKSNGHPTKASDCYALGMVIFEVLSGKTAFFPHGNHLVIKKVLDGERPERPEGEGGALFTDTIWEILKLCWKHKPGERTNAEAVLPCLERTLLQPSSEMDGTGTRPDASGPGTFSPFPEGLGLTFNRLCDMTAPGGTTPGETEGDSNSGCCSNCVIV